jgi:hypothetical protein
LRNEEGLSLEVDYWRQAGRQISASAVAGQAVGDPYVISNHSILSIRHKLWLVNRLS